MRGDYPQVEAEPPKEALLLVLDVHAVDAGRLTCAEVHWAWSGSRESSGREFRGYRSASRDRWRVKLPSTEQL